MILDAKLCRFYVSVSAFYLSGACTVLYMYGEVYKGISQHLCTED